MTDKGPCEGYSGCDFCDKCAKYVGNIPGYATAKSVVQTHDLPGRKQNGLQRDAMRCFTVHGR